MRDLVLSLVTWTLPSLHQNVLNLLMVVTSQRLLSIHSAQLILLATVPQPFDYIKASGVNTSFLRIGLLRCVQCCTLLSILLPLRLIDNLAQGKLGYALASCLWSLDCSLTLCFSSDQLGLSLYIRFGTWQSGFSQLYLSKILAFRHCKFVSWRLISLTAGPN